jgi:hypothetical protein
VRRLDSQALKTQFLQHLVEGRLALQICCGSRAKKLLRVRDRALPSGPVDFPPPRGRHAGTGFHYHGKVGPLKAAVQGAQDFIAGAATDDGARSLCWRAIWCAHQTRYARIVPPKIRNASPHNEASMTREVASRPIGPPCTLCGVIDTTISIFWGFEKNISADVRPGVLLSLSA